MVVSMEPWRFIANRIPRIPIETDERVSESIPIHAALDKESSCINAQL